MEKALAEGPGAGSEFPSFASSLSPGLPAGQSLASRSEWCLRVGLGDRAEDGRDSEAVWLGPLGKGTGTKWGAQVILPASSRSLQPSADTQQLRAGGGVRGREGKGERKSWCCRCP